MDFMDRHGIVPIRRRSWRDPLWGRQHLLELRLGNLEIGVAWVSEKGEVELRLYDSPKEVTEDA